MLQRIVGLISSLLLVAWLPGAEIPKNRETLAIDVRSTDGRPLPDAYVAVVPEDRPFRDPLHEEILKERSSARFTVSPGRYRMVCGAPGFETVYPPPFEVASGAGASQTINLRSLQPLRGRVVDEQGKPVAKARVGHWSAFLDRGIADFGIALSPLGEDYLRANNETVTDGSGAFGLPAVPNARHLVWVEAPGFAPGLLRDVLFQPPSDAGPWEIRLSRGAALEVSWDGTPAAGELMLRLAGLARGSPRPLAESLGLWERHLQGGMQTWASLPAGEVEVWLRPSRKGAHSQVPVRLAAERLSPGETKTVKLQIPPPAPETKIQSETAPSLRLLAVDLRTREPLTVTRWSAKSSAPQPAEIAVVSGGTRLDLKHGCIRPARFLIQTEGRVGALEQDQEPPCQETRRLSLYLAAEVRGTLSPPAGEKLPPMGLVHVSRCPERGRTQGEPLGAYPFRIETGGAFQAPVPSGCAVLTLDVGDFSPLAIDPRELAPRKTADLGARSLAYGGALLARIVDGKDGRPLDAVLVDAVPAPEVGSARQAAYSGRGSFTSLRTGKTAQGGWVRLYGLAPGDYFLRLQAPGRRLPHFAGPFGVRARNEALLDEVALPAPSSLEVVVRPGSGLAKAAQSFRVTAQPRDRAAGQPIATLNPEAGADNRFFFPDIPAGAWRISLLAVLDKDRIIPMRSTEIEIAPEDHPSITIESEADLYRGKVTYLGEPFDGSMMLYTVRLEERYGLSVPLTPKGTFEALLDKPGVYEARVFGGKKQLSGATVPEIHFEDPREEVRIEIPAGRIRGRVVDSKGNPVAGAAIEASSFRGPNDAGVAGSDLRPLSIHARSGNDGTFSLDGVLEGEWSVSAELGERKSLEKTIPLRPDETLDGVELELRDILVLSGTVQDEAGRPLASVRGSVSFFANGAELPPSASWMTDREGRFRLETLASALDLEANLSLSTPEGGIFAVRRRLSDGMILRMPSQSGEAELRLAEGQRWKELPSMGLWLVRDDGAYAPFKSVDTDARIKILPFLPPGPWRLVLIRSAAELALLQSGAGAQIPPIAKFQVEPGKRAEADVAVTKGGRE